MLWTGVADYYAMKNFDGPMMINSTLACAIAEIH